MLRLIVFTIFFVLSPLWAVIRDFADHEPSTRPWLIIAASFWFGGYGINNSVVWVAVFATNWLSLDPATPNLESKQGRRPFWFSFTQLIESISGVARSESMCGLTLREPLSRCRNALHSHPCSDAVPPDPQVPPPK